MRGFEAVEGRAAVEGAASISGWRRVRPEVLAWLLAALVLAAAVSSVPWLTTGAMIGAVLTFAVLRRPLLLVVIMLCLGPIDLSFLTGGEDALFAGLGGLDMNGIRLLAMVGGLFAVAVKNPDLRARLFGRRGRWYLVFLAYAAIAVLRSPMPLEGAKILVKLAYPLLFLVTIEGLVQSRRQLDRIGDVVLGGAAVITMLVNPLLFLGGGHLYDPYTGFRAEGVGVHPAPFSFYLLLMILIALQRFTVRRQARYLVLSGAAAFWIFLGMSRNAFLSGVVVFSVVGIVSMIRRRSYRTLATSALAVLAMILLLLPPFIEKTFPVGVPPLNEVRAIIDRPYAILYYISLSGREVIWPLIYQSFQAAPLFGHGLGSTMVTILSSFPTEAVQTPHNEYLRLLADTGLVGLLLFMAAISVWLIDVVRAAARRVGRESEWVIPALGAILLLAVTSAGDNSLDFYSSVGQYVALLVAAAVIFPDLPETTDSPEDSAAREEIASP